MGADQINAISNGVGASWTVLIIILSICAPLLIPLLKREREKPSDPTAALFASIKGLEKRIDEVEDDHKSLSREMDKLEMRVNLHAEIRKLGQSRD